MSKIYILMGKSATGKDTIYKDLLENKNLDLSTIVTYTTRPMRENEHEGIEYNFVSKERLYELKKENKVIEHREYNTVYGIWDYFTVEDSQIQLEKKDYIIIGTLESFLQIKKYYGSEIVIPIYVEVDDGTRLQRALDREREQKQPKYEEMCRRFLADAKDFGAEKLKEANIKKVFRNIDLSKCVKEIIEFISKEKM